MLIVQWHNQGHIEAVEGQTIDFEVKVFSSPSGGVYAQFLYQDTEFGGTHAAFNNGLSATIGYLNDANAAANNIQYSFNTASVQSGAVLSVVVAGTGACCLPSGACTVMSTGECSVQGGIYRGNTTTCPSNCPQPGACCVSLDNTCVVVQQAACTALGGTFRGGGTSCAAACPNANICYSATALGVPILSSGTAGTPGPVADAVLVIGASQVINGMTARINISHTFQGDVRVRLVHPDTTGLDLIARPGVASPKYSNNQFLGFGTNNFGNPGTGAWMVFSDTGANGVFDDATGFPGPPAGTAVATLNPTGDWQAEDGRVDPAAVGSLAATFNGKNINGTWHLEASDHWPLDAGTINAFSVCFTPAPAAACYANCDSSTIQPCLNVQDFTCFLNNFSSATTYANCDGSTTVPVLNVQDFTCFLNRFAAGCSGC